MTELYIDGKLSVLPNDQKFSIVEENPFLTKSGEFSFDIELNLKDPDNAKIFRHINRFNNVYKPQVLPATLIIDNRVRMKGTAVVLEKKDTFVRVQLLSGNSELNYFIGSDQKIGDLNLGSESIGQYEAVSSLYSRYPEYKYVCAPVYVVQDSGNNIYLNSHALEDDTDEKVYNIRMMPYLLTYVEKIIQALGYTIAENQLTQDEVLCRLFIPHRLNTFEYSKILSDWTIKDFLLEIEKFCNVVFLIDKAKSSVRIIFNFNRKQGIDKVYIDEIVNEYHLEYDKDNKIDVLKYDSVRYNFPENDYYKYRYIADKKELFKEITVDEYETYTAMSTATPGNLDQYYNRNNIYHVNKFQFPTPTTYYYLDFDNYYVISRKPNPGSTSGYSYFRRLVDNFRPIGDTEGEVIELNIIPAHMIGVTDENNPSGSVIVNTLPVLYYSAEDPEENLGVIDMIEDGIPNKKENDGKIPVAIFMEKDLFDSPISQTDIFDNDIYGESMNKSKEFFNDWGLLTEEQKNNKINRQASFTLRLSTKYGRYEKSYGKNDNITTNEIWTISFRTNQNISPQNQFVINGKKFICISLETEFDMRGALPVIKGKFYPEDDN